MKPEPTIHILLTRPVSAESISDTAEKNVQLDVVDLIRTEAAVTETERTFIRTTAETTATVVFTSMNAVTAVTEALSGLQPNWKIYSVGETTGKLIQEYFGERSVSGIAKDAATLAALIVTRGKTDRPLIFFCGEKHRDELPDRLRSNGLELKEIVVYKSFFTPQMISKDYDGILFFSPSAVQSFFSVNTVNTQTILFAIGNTTAAEIANHCDNKVVAADKPGKNELLQLAVNYFKPSFSSIK